MDYKKIIFILLVFFVLIVIGLLQGGLSIFKNPTAKINNQTFKLEVAKTEEEKQIGLSKHKKLSEDKGMIFIFDKPSYYSFWMKDMKFPIDILYINGDRIVTIYESQQVGSPIVVSPSEPSDKVLEIKAGLAKKYKIKLGDKVTFKNL